MKSIGTENRSVVAGGWRENGEWLLMCLSFFGGWLKCPGISGDSCTSWIYYKLLTCTLEKGEFYGVWIVS